MRIRTMSWVVAIAVATTMATLAPVRAQVGSGLIDPNIASEAQLTGLPHMTPAIVKSLMGRRPFAGIAELNTFLLEQKLTAAQATELYEKAFVHVNLNTATREEIMLIPRAGTRMAREFASTGPGRPGRSSTRKSASTVGQPETDRLKQYSVHSGKPEHSHRRRHPHYSGSG